MKHHYISAFYTKHWAILADHRVCQFTLHSRGVASNRRAPAAIGFQEDLYSIPGAPPAISAYLEDQFFRVADQEAALSLEALLSGRLNQIDDGQKSGWARFIMTLLNRTPERIKWFGKVWAGMHAEAKDEAEKEIAKAGSDPDQLEEFENSFAGSFVKVMQSMMDSTTIGRFIVNMRWGVIELHDHQRLMTSDRPVLLTGGIRQPDAQIVVPLSPSKLFIAANDAQILQNLIAIDAREISARLNDAVVRQAEKYFFAVDDSQFAFVANRLGRQPSQFIAPAHLLKKYSRD